MNFQHTHEWIFGISPHTGKPKTQTRRLVKPGENARTVGYRYFPSAPPAPIYGEICKPDGTVRYAVHRSYAVQPGRGIKAIGRICITALWREDVRYISIADARAEGFDSPLRFLETWTQMHDNGCRFYQLDGDYRYYAGRKDKWGSKNESGIWEILTKRPAEYYTAWALLFEAVRS